MLYSGASTLIEPIQKTQAKTKRHKPKPSRRHVQSIHNQTLPAQLLCAAETAHSLGWKELTTLLSNFSRFDHLFSGLDAFTEYSLLLLTVRSVSW